MLSSSEKEERFHIPNPTDRPCAPFLQGWDGMGWDVCSLYEFWCESPRALCCAPHHPLLCWLCVQPVPLLPGVLRQLEQPLAQSEELQ